MSNKKKVYVTKRSTFEASHLLTNYDGKCSRLHGHSYKLEVTFVGMINTLSCELCGDTDPHIAMVYDFSDLKKAIKEVSEKYDHSFLNDFFTVPTAEVMCVQIFEDLKNLIGHSDVEVYSVKLWETEDSYAEYRGE